MSAVTYHDFLKVLQHFLSNFKENCTIIESKALQNELGMDDDDFLQYLIDNDVEIYGDFLRVKLEDKKSG